MTHYYEEHLFTTSQAIHATGVVGELMREHRFFPHQHDTRSTRISPDYVLNPDVFADAIKLDKKIRGVYREARLVAEASISELEGELGVKEPDLSGNKQVVQCSRYTGGFDICRVYPITAFTGFLPQSKEALTTKLFKQIMGENTEDDLSPTAFRWYCKKAEQLANIIWSQFETFDAYDPDNHRCLIILKSRINMGNSSDFGDFADNRLPSLQDYPHAVGYLLQAHSMKTRIVEHSYVVSSTSRRSHVRLAHWDNKPPSVDYEATGGYSGSVMFATIL